MSRPKKLCHAEQPMRDGHHLCLLPAGHRGRHRCGLAGGKCNFRWLIFYLLLSTFYFSACSTTAPNRPTVVAYSGNEQNAGIIGFYKNGALIITDGKRDEYNALIDRFGARIIPPLIHDAGLTPGTDPAGCWIMDREHVAKFGLMKRWQHRGES